MSYRSKLFSLGLIAAVAARGADQTATLRIAGDPAVSSVVQYWVEGYQRLHPDVTITTHLSGTDTGMAALYTGTADLTLMGRSPYPIEIQAFEWVFKYKPAQIPVMSGSLDRDGASPALVLVVNSGNPLVSLGLDQLARVFGGDPTATAPKTWGDLGLGGAWKDRPVHLYMPDAMSGTGRFFRHVVLADGRMMNWDQITEFTDAGDASANHQVASAVAADPDGLGVSSMEGLPAAVRAVAIGSKGGAPAELATRETVVDRTYLFSRSVIACFNRAAGKRVPPPVADFLNYVLGEAGQGTVAATGGFLPLEPAYRSAQQAALR